MRACVRASASVRVCMRVYCHEPCSARSALVHDGLLEPVVERVLLHRVLVPVAQRARAEVLSQVGTA